MLRHPLVFRIAWEKRGSGNFRPGVNSNVGSLSAPANVEQVPKELKHGVNTAQRHLLGTVNATDISLAEAIKTVEDAIRYFDDDEASTSDSFHYSRLARVVEQYSHQLGDVATQFNSQCPNLIWSMLLSCKLTLSDLLNSLNEMNKFMSSTTVVSSTNPAETPKPEVNPKFGNYTNYTNTSAPYTTPMGGGEQTPKTGKGGDGSDLFTTSKSGIVTIAGQNYTNGTNGSHFTNYTETHALFTPPMGWRTKPGNRYGR